MAPTTSGSGGSTLVTTTDAGDAVRSTLTRLLTCAVTTACVLTVLPMAVSAAERGWTIQPLPALPVGELLGVSCAGPDACDAVGLGSPGTSLHGALADRWDGSSWSQIEADSTDYPQPSPLEGVSCPAAEMCLAVGNAAYAGGGGQSMLAQTLTVSGTQDVTPPPVGLPPEYDGLSAVSCTSPTRCIAVGSSNLNAFATLIERWDGTAWEIQTAAPQPDELETLLGVSCDSPSFCAAVGGYNEAGSAGAALAETWDGSAWTLGQIPAPPGTQTAALDSVSCPAAGDCVAVGVRRDQARTGHALIERLRHGGWTPVRVPSPGGAAETALSGVSCPAAGACMAVGSAIDANGTSHSLALRLHRGQWRLESTPGAPGALGDSLASVSCPTRRVCTAVGATDGEPLAERWVAHGLPPRDRWWRPRHPPRQHHRAQHSGRRQRR